MTTAPAPAPATPRRRGIRFGLLALVFSVVGPVWLVFVFTTVVSGLGSAYDPVRPETTALDVITYGLVMVGYVGAPLLIILAIVFGIVAIARGSKAGRLMGVLALVLLVLFVGVVVAFVFLITTALTSFT